MLMILGQPCRKIVEDAERRNQLGISVAEERKENQSLNLDEIPLYPNIIPVWCLGRWESSQENARSFSLLAAAANVAESGPEAGSLAAIGAAGISSALGAGGIVGSNNVSGTSTADVGEGGLGADFGAGELLGEGHDGALGGGMGVTGTTAARVEAASAGRSGLDLGRDAGGGGRSRGTEEVTSTTTAGVSVAVLSYGWVWLGDEVGSGRHFGWCLCVSVTESSLW